MNNEFCRACRAGDLSLSWAPLHPQISVAAGALNFDSRHVGREREKSLARTAFQFDRPMVYTGDQDLGACGTWHFLLHPLSPCGLVVNTDASIAKRAVQLPQTGRQQPIAFGAAQWRRRNP